MRATTALALLLAPAFALAACGGADEQEAAAGADRRERNRDAALDFARCMRENGVDMPDPQVGERGGLMFRAQRAEAGSARPAPERLRKAEEACREHLDGMEPPPMSEEQQREFRERALEHAKCMREQGIDFPDPQFGEDGRATMRLEGGDPDSPAFRRAMEACRDEMGGGPMIAPGGGS